jgi:hypothetical protein
LLETAWTGYNTARKRGAFNPSSIMTAYTPATAQSIQPPPHIDTRKRWHPQHAAVPQMSSRTSNKKQARWQKIQRRGKAHAAKTQITGRRRRRMGHTIYQAHTVDHACSSMNLVFTLQ